MNDGRKQITWAGVDGAYRRGRRGPSQGGFHRNTAYSDRFSTCTSTRVTYFSPSHTVTGQASSLPRILIYPANGLILASIPVLLSVPINSKSLVFDSVEVLEKALSCRVEDFGYLSLGG